MINVKPTNNMAAPNNAVTGGSISSESASQVNLKIIIKNYIVQFCRRSLYLFIFLQTSGNDDRMPNNFVQTGTDKSKIK